MGMKELSEAAIEINSIFENMSSEILNKIPKKLQNFFREIASKTYTFEYDKNKTLEKQSLKLKTKGIIALIYRDYICNQAERKDYINKYNNFYRTKKNEKLEFCNKDDMFKRKKFEMQQIEKLPIIYKKDNYFKKILNKLKIYLKIKKK